MKNRISLNIKLSSTWPKLDQVKNKRKS